MQTGGLLSLTAKRGFQVGICYGQRKKNKDRKYWPSAKLKETRTCERPDTSPLFFCRQPGPFRVVLPTGRDGPKPATTPRILQPSCYLPGFCARRVVIGLPGESLQTCPCNGGKKKVKVKRCRHEGLRFLTGWSLH